MKRFFSFLLCVFLFYACDNDKLAQDEYRTGSTIHIPNEPDLSVNVLNHLCPCNVACVWPGYIDVMLTSSDDTLSFFSSNMDSITDYNLPKEINYRSHRLRLVDFTLLPSCENPDPTQTKVMIEVY